MLGLPFVAVMPRATSPEKVAMIEHYGGQCHLVDDATTVGEVSRQVAAECGGHFMDQFTYAERATDWRGNNNIAESMFDQLALERQPGGQNGRLLRRKQAKQRGKADEK